MTRKPRARAALMSSNTFGEREVARLPERLDLLREDDLRAVVVAERRQDRGVGRQRDGRQGAALALEAADELDGAAPRC